MARGVAPTPEIWKRVSRSTRFVESIIGRGSDPAPDLSLVPQATFFNDSGHTIPAYGIFYDDDVTMTQNHPIVTAKRPSTTFKWFYYVNGPFDVEDGDYGQFQVTPMVRVKYVTDTPAAGDGFGAVPDTFTVRKNYPSQFMCRKIIDDDNDIMLAYNFGSILRVFGQTQGSIAKNATNGVVEVYSGAPGSGASIITSMTITGVHNPWETVADNKKVKVELENGLPTLGGKEC